MPPAANDASPATSVGRIVAPATGRFTSPPLPCRVPAATASDVLPEPLPMYSAAGEPDAWHNVTAPGGYEWWYFDAESTDGRTRIVAILLEGFVFHPGYLRAYKRYLKRPTKVAPPTAGQFPCAYLCVYRDGKIAHQFMAQYRPDQFRASADVPDVEIGSNTMTRDGGGDYRLSLAGHPWQVTARGPQTDRDRQLTANLTFSPSFGHKPLQKPFLSREMTGADHRWVLAAPHCRVSGTVDPGNGEPIQFDGLGYHDHNYGTAPLGPGLKRWVWGRVLREDSVIGFHVAEPKTRRLPPEPHLFRVDRDGVHELPAEEVAIDWRARSWNGLPHPWRLRFDWGLRLSAPKPIDVAPFYSRVVYRATVDLEPATAFCEIAHPHRLRWPVLGRMIEMSIDKSALSATPTSPASPSSTHRG